VQLTTTYLDERVRLGKGSRGSLFVFERTAAADAAGEPGRARSQGRARRLGLAWRLPRKNTARATHRRPAVTPSPAALPECLLE
jgi:hypothetical protein